MSDPNFDELEELLSEIFRERVSIEGGEQGQFGDAELSVVEMGYERTNDSGDGPRRTQRFRQTALILRDPALEVPEFRLAPTQKGLLGGLLSLVGGMGDINFDDSPEFSDAYFLHGWAEESVRLLFNPTLREHLANNVGWSAIGKNNVLVVFRVNKVVDGADRELFKSQGLEALSLFQQAEEALDDMPNVRRETTAEDMSATAERMGGLAGSMLQRQLNKLRVTRSEMDKFAAQQPPRDIPVGVKRQVIGDNIVLIFVGILFIAIGLGVGGAFILFSDKKVPIFVYLFPIVQPLIGSLIVFFTLRYRIRKSRTLRGGQLVEANVTDIKATDTTVNGQRRFKVTAEYSEQGQPIIKEFSAYGGAVDPARKRKSDGKPMRILIDPKDPQHVIGLDLLLVFDDA